MAVGVPWQTTFIIATPGRVATEWAAAALASPSERPEAWKIAGDKKVWQGCFLRAVLDISYAVNSTANATPWSRCFKLHGAQWRSLTRGTIHDDEM